MYGDSHALSSDSSSIFPSNLKLKEEVSSIDLLMESDAETEFKHELLSCNNSSQNSSGLLRFRSAPTSLLTNFTFGGEKGENLGSRFCSDEVNSMHVVSENDDCKGSVNRFTAMDSQLPPQYPRQSGGQLGYRVVSSLDEQGQQGKFGSSPLRQNSSPAGIFSSQNGIFIFFIILICCLVMDFVVVIDRL